MLRDKMDVIGQLACLLHANGQQTEETTRTVSRVARTWDEDVVLLPGWDSIAIIDPRSTDGSGVRLLCRQPSGVAMNRVAAAGKIAQAATDGVFGVTRMASELRSANALPLVSDTAFSLASAAGAIALALGFGAGHWSTLLIIGVSAGGGAALRRWVGHAGGSPFLQVFVAAMLAGLLGAAWVRLGLSSDLRLVAVCPCMVMVPGPHLLNGTLDLLAERLPLGWSRLSFAALTLFAISAGLLCGLLPLHVTLPPAPPGRDVPLLIAIVTGAAAAACYATFFSLPRHLLGWPIVTAMLVDGSRWLSMSVLHLGPVVGAGIAGLLAGTLLTPVSRRWHVPFAGIGFAAVVSLMPGVFVFRMAAAIVTLPGATAASVPALVGAIALDGLTASLIVISLSLGMVLPKHLYDACLDRRGGA